MAMSYNVLTAIVLSVRIQSFIIHVCLPQGVLLFRLQFTDHRRHETSLVSGRTSGATGYNNNRIKVLYMRTHTHIQHIGDALSADLKNDVESLMGNFKAYFGKTELDYVFADETVFSRVQRPGEKARDYISHMAKQVPHLQEEILHWVILRGLRPWIKASIIAQKGDLKTVTDILECAKVAESAGLGKEYNPTDTTRFNELVHEVRAGRDEVKQLSARMAKMSVATALPRSPTPERRQQRVSFREPYPDAGAQPFNGPPSYVRGGRAFRGQWRPLNTFANRQYGQSTTGTPVRPCDRCGRFHGLNNRCPALNATCFGCGRRGHLRVRCRSARRGAMGISE